MDVVVDGERHDPRPGPHQPSRRRTPPRADGGRLQREQPGDASAEDPQDAADLLDCDRGVPQRGPHGRGHECTQGLFVDRPHGGKGLAGGTLSLPLPCLQLLHGVVLGMDPVDEVVARSCQRISTFWVRGRCLAAGRNRPCQLGSVDVSSVTVIEGMTIGMEDRRPCRATG